MYEILNESQQSELSGIFSNHFSLFSEQSNNFISVIKTPISIINNPNENVLPGYGADTQNVTDITYQPVTGVFPAIIIYPHNLQGNQFGQLKFDIDDNQVMIKVEENCKNYILVDGIERIFIDNQAYNIERSFKVQSYLGLKYYYFKLTVTK